MVSVPVANPFDTAYVDFDPTEPNKLTGSVAHDGVVFIEVQSSGARDMVSSGSGSLLYTGRHILTAAHVLPDNLSNLSQMGITFGSPEGSVNFSTVDNQIEDIDIHPQWGGVNSNVEDGFDVAVITLAEEAPLWADRYSLYAKNDEIGNTTTHVGFGRPSNGVDGYAEDQGEPVRRFGKNTYDASLEPDQLDGSIASLANAITIDSSSNMILLYDFDSGQPQDDPIGDILGAHLGLGSQEVGTTPGDSGGPTFIDGKIAGIASFTMGNPLADGQENEGVFGEIHGDTRVSSFVDFIESIVGSENPDAPLGQRVSVTSFQNNGMSSSYYLAQNPDVSAAGMDAGLHYFTFGKNEGRNPNPYFDTNEYLRVNADVAAAGVDALGHYMEFGWKEGRDPSQIFSTNLYLTNNTDVAQAGMNPLQHYFLFGFNEGRNTYYSIEDGWQ
jgi:secreted trypsin-like serine protease